MATAVEQGMKRVTVLSEVVRPTDVMVVVDGTLLVMVVVRGGVVIIEDEIPKPLGRFPVGRGCAAGVGPVPNGCETEAVLGQPPMQDVTVVIEVVHVVSMIAEGPEP